ncbi:MAG TPA: primosomal protein N' [Terriglobia bacterium]|nr:primosomal protein N' [Terriglobia bacterium]
MSARKKPDRLIDVAVIAALRNPLTYRVPEGMDVRAGHRVQVPLGTRQAHGIALEPRTRLAPGVKVREISRVLDPEPLLSPELLTLGLWIAEYYLAPVGEVFRAMLPLISETRRARGLTLTEAGRKKLEDLRSSLLGETRDSKEASFLLYIAGEGRARAEISYESVRRKFGASPQLLASALAEGLVTLSETTRERGQRKIMSVRLISGPVPVIAGQRVSPVAQRILEALGREGPVDDHRVLLKSARADLAALKKLEWAGRLELHESEPGGSKRPQESGALVTGPRLPVLSSAQSLVLKDLRASLEKQEFKVVLLQGVTASGKTEIYLRLIADCLERGRDALMLVPEIALTPSVQSQFIERFGDRVALLHSGLSERERNDDWWHVRHGDAKVVLGTRSAVFAPLANPGLIIVDEEHDPSYKQQETPRYHGRDVAVVRARLARALTVLGSATPSLESAHNAREGKYRILTLSERIGGRPLASVEIVDMRQEFRETFSQVPVSRRLRQEIDSQLRNGAQTMILLNRRGYSWFVLCRSCGQTQRCVNCSISLTYHRREHRLMCHYCGYSALVPNRCPACDSEHLHYVGEGTEKLEDKFAELFPGARVARLDRDVARRRGQFIKTLSEFRERKIDILVGTQLIAKGHDFPGVTLVGVVSVDAGLRLPDFRAAERTFQLLTQAAGRAGRGEAPGRVLVQTFYPEHYAVRLAAEQNYEMFFTREMRFRRLMHYPPWTALANIIAQDTKLDRAAQVARQIERFFNASEKESKALKILGPSPAPLARVEGRFRIQFLVKAGSRARLNDVLRRLADHCDQLGVPPRAVMIDMDPVNLM